jgi:hypothetical protein
MTALRRRVRAVAFAWLLCQVASLSAFVPAVCCAAHAAEAAAKQQAASCHDAAPVAPKDGDACPMHHSSRAHDCCKMTNGCEGPGVHLAGLFAYVGVIETPSSSSISLASTAAIAAAESPLLHRLATPDAPPPKR